MTNNTEYNGWTNKATWQVNLWLGDWFSEYASENNFEEDGIDELARQLEEMTWEHLELPSNQGSLLLDMVNSYMADVNWAEIAKAAIE